MRRSQNGYFLIIAIVFIFIIAFLGVILGHLFTSRANIGANLLDGYRSFYLAETGLEIGSRLLTRSDITGPTARLSCDTMTGNSSITNASLLNGQLTITADNNVAKFAISTLSNAINATATTIPVTNAALFAPSGSVIIDREPISYAAVSGNSLVGAVRGGSGVLASSHVSGAVVSQYQCSLTVKSALPTLNSPQAQRELQWAVHLQDAWAVGSATGNLNVAVNWNRMNELSWTNASFPSSQAAELYSVDMLSSGELWAVGSAERISGTNYYTIVHADGVNIISSVYPGACSGQDLNGVSMVSETEGWAVGIRYRPSNCSGGQNRYTVLKWNGSAWTELSPPAIPVDNNANQNLQAVHVIDTTGDGVGNFGFAVGVSGTILAYNGTTWTRLSSPTSQTLRGVYAVSINEAWAVGGGGIILRWNGSTWSSVSSPTTQQLNAISMLDSSGNGSADFGIAVGNSGRILVYNGSSWSNSVTSGNNLMGIAIFNSQDAWAVGASGTTLHWNGSAWANINSNVSTTLNAVAAIRNLTPASAWKQVFN